MRQSQMTAAVVAFLFALACGSMVSAHNVTFCTWHGSCQIDNYNVSHRLGWAEERFTCTLPPVNTSYGWWQGSGGEHDMHSMHGRRLLHNGEDHDMGMGDVMDANMGWACDADRLAAGCMDTKLLHTMPDHTMYMNVCMPAVLAAADATNEAQIWFDSVVTYADCLQNSTMPAMDCEPEELDTWTAGLMAEDPPAASAAGSNLTDYILAVSAVCQAASTPDACAFASETAKNVTTPPLPVASNDTETPPPSPASVSGAMGRSLAAACALVAALIALCL